jgi:hypothetical protein
VRHYDYWLSPTKHNIAPQAATISAPLAVLEFIASGSANATQFNAKDAKAQRRKDR